MQSERSTSSETGEKSSNTPLTTGKFTKPSMTISRDGPYQRHRKVVDREELGILKSLADAVMKPEIVPQEDDDETFGRFIAGEVRNISDARIKLVLKQKISNAVFNAKLECMQSTQPAVHSQYPYQPPAFNYPGSFQQANPGLSSGNQVQPTALQMCNEYSASTASSVGETPGFMNLLNSSE